MEPEIKNARITGTKFGIEDHGILTFMIYLDYGGSGQGFGGWALDRWNKSKKKRIGGNGKPITLILEILNVVGVDNWEDLKGKYVRAEIDHTHVFKIGNILKNNWVDPEKTFGEK